MAVDLRLKRVGVGNPNDYPQVDFRAEEGRPWPFDLYYSLIGPPELTYDTQGRENSATYRFRVNVLDVKRAIPNILGYSDRGGAGTLKRVLPFNDPDGYGMVAVSATATYMGPSGYDPLTGQINETWFQKITGRDQTSANGEAEKMYNYAILTVRFVHLPYVICDDVTAQAGLGERSRYCTTTQQAAAEYISLDRSVIYWNDAACPAYIANNNKPITVATGGGLIRNYFEVVTTWYRLPFDAYVTLMPKWRALLSTVNASTTDDGTGGFSLPVFDRFITFEPECLLFCPWRVREHVDPRGFPEVEVELHWLYRNNGDVMVPKGWNHFLYPPDGNYYRVTWGDGITNAAKPIYPSADHTAAFKP